MIIIALVAILLIVAGIFLYRLNISKGLVEVAQPHIQSGTGASLLIIGDSTGVGVGAGTPQESIAGRLGKTFPNISIENCARSGATIREVNDQLSCARKDRYDVVILQAGANDVLTTRNIKAVEEELSLLLSDITKRADAVFFMSSGDIGDARIFPPLVRGMVSARTDVFYDRYKEIAEEYGKVSRVELRIPEVGDLFVSKPRRYLARDMFHPSSAGYGLWFDVLKTTMEDAGVWQKLQ